MESSKSGICFSSYSNCESNNVEFIANWNFGNVIDSYDMRYYSDIWGYTDADGKEFALIGSWDGTHIIDISNEIPQETGFIEGATSVWRDIKTFGNYMYIGTEANFPGLLSSGPEGIQVVDLTDPYNPILVNEWDLIDQSHNINNSFFNYLK